MRSLLPAHLGRNFRWVWSSTTIGNLGDGVLLAAGPLLVASFTRQPFAVAMAVLAQRLPWLLFGVVAGAVIDRLDRRRLLVWVDSLRAVVVGVLALSVALQWANLPVIYAAMFLVGTAETFADNAGSALVPDVVPTERIGQANARIFGAWVVTNQLAGPPLGAFLFGLGAAFPFGFNAVSFALSAVLISRLRLSRKDAGTTRTTLKAEVGEGLRWLWSHPPMRTLTVMITILNVTFGAAFSVWVLYAFERLGLGSFGFGLLMTASAVGGLGGSVAFGWLERRLGYATLLRIGLVIETLTHLALGLTTNAWLAGGIMALFGVHATVLGTTSSTVRQRAVPGGLLGRVTSVYMIGSIGALAVGTLIGGVLAQQFGILTPFWFAFAGSAVITALLWRSMTNVADSARVPRG